jgi:hypothetical protein
MRGELTFARSTDYAAIRRLLVDPHCYRRMAGPGGPDPEALEVGPRESVEFVLAEENGLALAVFLLVRLAGAEAEVHFCFAPEAWGHTRAIAQGFLRWVWANADLTRLVGPVPTRNRLALQLAKACGFSEFDTDGGLTLLEIRKP